MANECLSVNPMNAVAFYVLGLCSYYSGELNEAVDYFERAQTMDQSYIKAIEMERKADNFRNEKKKGLLFVPSLVCPQQHRHCIEFYFVLFNLAEILLGLREYREAKKVYNDALQIDPFNTRVNSTLNFNIALVSNQLEQRYEVIQFCTSALLLDADYLKALTLRASTYMELKFYQKAVDDYRRAAAINANNNAVALALQNAEACLERWLENDYFVLGVDVGSTVAEIKRAYHNLSRAHHPDRHSNEPDSVKAEHERVMKRITNAKRNLIG